MTSEQPAKYQDDLNDKMFVIFQSTASQNFMCTSIARGFVKMHFLVQ